jgi:hypothetical protein
MVPRVTAAVAAADVPHVRSASYSDAESGSAATAAAPDAKVLYIYTY